MRTGEVCALLWDDIDFEKGIINIKRNVFSKVKDDKGRWYFGTPKTSNSNRQVYMCETLINSLKNYKQRQDKLKKEYKSNYNYYHLEDVIDKYGNVKEQRIVETKRKRKNCINANLIFTKKDGTYIGTDLIRYPFKVIHKELGIYNCRFYDLRGSFATKSLRSGVEIKDVAAILGHSRIETTENYYISTSEEAKKEASNIFEKTVQSETINDIINYKL